jgi:hypothetical protein
MTTLRDEPPPSVEDLREILLQQLSYYRATLLSKLDGLSEDQLATSILPSGWSPLGLLKHLVFVERRWMQWAFAAEQISDPRGDHDSDSDVWLVEPDDTLVALTQRLAAVAANTEAIACKAELTDQAELAVGSPAIRPHSAGSWSISSTSMRGISGIWMWCASLSTGLLANNPVVPCAPICALSLSKGPGSVSPIARKEPAQSSAKLVTPGLPGVPVA